MNSEKVKEIKKALENNITEHFLFINENKWKYLRYADILTYINELESENERLKPSEFNSCQELDNVFSQIHSLETRIAELKEDKEKWQRKAINYYEKAKSYGIECIIDTDINEINFERRHKAIVFLNEKQLKQFAEKVAKRLINYSDIKQIFDETLKEFLND